MKTLGGFDCGDPCASQGAQPAAGSYSGAGVRRHGDRRGQAAGRSPRVRVVDGRRHDRYHHSQDDGSALFPVCRLLRAAGRPGCALCDGRAVRPDRLRALPGSRGIPVRAPLPGAQGEARRRLHAHRGLPVRNPHAEGLGRAGPHVGDARRSNSHGAQHVPRHEPARISSRKTPTP